MSALGAQFDFIKDEIRGAWRFRRGELDRWITENIGK